MINLNDTKSARCAKACGWIRVKAKAGYGKEYQWAPGHTALATKWWEKDGKWQGIDPHPNWLDPLFWFPRLWEALRSTLGDRPWPVYCDKRCALVDDCLALCSAIETLEKEGKWLP